MRQGLLFDDLKVGDSFVTATNQRGDVAQTLTAKLMVARRHH